MANLIAISNKTHKNLKVNPALCLVEQSDTHLIPVVINEFAQLSAQYPLVFAKNSDTGKFVCTAMMGLGEGENLFIDDRGVLNSFCLPLNLARQPFFLGLGDESTDDDMVVCVDLDHPSVATNDGAPVFDDSGEQTKLLHDVSAILATLYHGDKETVQFTERLSALELLTPMTLNITLNDDSNSQINGLYTIDEDKLAGLDADSLKALHDDKHLAAAYTMLASLGQIQAMIHHKNKML